MKNDDNYTKSPYKLWFDKYINVMVEKGLPELKLAVKKISEKYDIPVSQISKNYNRNKKLIDLREIPQEYKELIINKYEGK